MAAELVEVSESSDDTFKSRSFKRAIGVGGSWFLTTTAATELGLAVARSKGFQMSPDVEQLARGVGLFITFSLGMTHGFGAYEMTEQAYNRWAIRMNNIAYYTKPFLPA